MWVGEPVKPQTQQVLTRAPELMRDATDAQPGKRGCQAQPVEEVQPPRHPGDRPRLVPWGWRVTFLKHERGNLVSCQDERKGEPNRTATSNQNRLHTCLRTGVGIGKRQEQGYVLCSSRCRRRLALLWSPDQH